MSCRRRERREAERNGRMAEAGSRNDCQREAVKGQEQQMIAK